MLSPIQGVLLEMIKWFDHYCVSNHLKYYVIGGTLLGAIRHKGFIPWDDDIDVALPREDYNKLINQFQKMEGKYLLESPYSGRQDFLYSYSKLYDTTTTLIERTNQYCKRGVYIDVFPLDGIGNSKQECLQNYKKIDRVNMLLMARTCAFGKQRALYKNVSIFFARLIPSFVINNKQLSMQIDKLASMHSFGSSKFVGNLMGAYRFKEIFSKDFIGNTTRYPFENISVCGFENYDAYLTHIYGNWHQIPHVSKRHGAHEYLRCDLNKSYLSS